VSALLPTVEELSLLGISKSPVPSSFCESDSRLDVDEDSLEVKRGAADAAVEEGADPSPVITGAEGDASVADFLGSTAG